MESTRKVLTNNLRRLRKAAGHTQAEFAELIGLSTRGYQKYEQGETMPPLDMMDLIARTLKVTTQQLLLPESARMITDLLRKLDVPYDSFPNGEHSDTSKNIGYPEQSAIVSHDKTDLTKQAETGETQNQVNIRHTTSVMEEVLQELRSVREELRGMRADQEVITRQLLLQPRGKVSAQELQRQAEHDSDQLKRSIGKSKRSDHGSRRAKK